jgi:hypothetical protein
MSAFEKQIYNRGHLLVFSAFASHGGAGKKQLKLHFLVLALVTFGAFEARDVA